MNCDNSDINDRSDKGQHDVGTKDSKPGHDKSELQYGDEKFQRSTGAVQGYVGKREKLKEIIEGYVHYRGKGDSGGSFSKKGDSGG